MYIFILMLLFLSSTNMLGLNNTSKFIDLTWPLVDNTTIYWPDGIPFKLTSQNEGIKDDEYWYSAKEFCTGDHAGTHMNAPYRHNEDRWQINEIPIDKFFAHGILIDISQEIDWNQPRNLEVSDFTEWENENGDIPRHCVVLVKFGWSRYYCARDIYLGDFDNEFHFPGISTSAAEWLITKDNIIGIGVDVASVDPGNSTNFEINRIFSNANLFTLANVKIDTELPDIFLSARNFIVMCLPMHIRRGSGAPVRIIAVISKLLSN